MGLPGIKRARKMRGLTQEDLAEMIGLKRAIVSKYESGAVSPSADMLRKMSEALGVTVDYLLADDEPPAMTPLSRADLTEEDTQSLAVELEVPESAIDEMIDHMTDKDMETVQKFLTLIIEQREKRNKNSPTD